MILSNSKISARQLNRLILTAGTGTLMMLLPDVAGSGETGIVSLFVAFGITLVHLKIVFWLVEKSSFQTERHDPCADKETGITSNNQNRKEGRKTNLPKRKNGESMFGNGSFSVHIILNLASIIEFIKCLALSAGFLLAAANTVRTILLPGKSFALVATVWLAGVVYLASAGTEARGRFAEAVWLIALLPLAFLLLMCLAHIGKHGSITEGALISFEILEHNGAIILLRGILYSAVFAPVELIYWCRDKISWDVPSSRSSKITEPAADGQLQNLSEAETVDRTMNRGSEGRKTANRKSGERNTVYRKTERAISSAVCIVFLFAILFTAAAVGILGIQGIQATEHSAMAIAAGLDVMGAIVAQKQGIAVLFFLTGMLTASGVLLEQMGRFVRMAVEVISGEKEKRRGKTERITDIGEEYISMEEEERKGKSPGDGSEKNSNRGSDNGNDRNSNRISNGNSNGNSDRSRNRGKERKNHVISLCLALLIWCVAAGLYGRFVNPASGEQTAESGNNTGTADSMDTVKSSGTTAASLTTTAQIEDRAYCTAIGIDLAGEFENTQSHDESEVNVRNQNTVAEDETKEDETEEGGGMEKEEAEDSGSEENESENPNRLIWNVESESAYIFTMEIAQGSDMEASFVTCEAGSLAEAAAIFNANSDRELDISHLQILLLGNSLLERGSYRNVLMEFGDAAEYYFGGTLLAFTEETANEYIENYADNYDSEGTAVGMHLKKRFEQGLKSEKAVLGTVYYRWINHEEEEPAEWIPTLTLN